MELKRPVWVMNRLCEKRPVLPFFTASFSAKVPFAVMIATAE
jgi:hypothetical protein